MSSFHDAYRFLLLDRGWDLDDVERLKDAAVDAAAWVSLEDDAFRAALILEAAEDVDGVLASLRRARALVGSLARMGANPTMSRKELDKIRSNEGALNILCSVVAGMHRRRPDPRDAAERAVYPLDDGGSAGDGGRARLARAVLAASRKNSTRAPDAAEFVALAVIALLEPPTDSDPGAPPDADDEERKRRVKRWAETIRRVRRKLPHAMT